MEQYGSQQSPRRIPPSNGQPTPPIRGAPEPLRSAQAPNGLSRAEKFEDEKQRIMKSCFSRRDDKGQLLQSYITHIRVEEDAMYPSDPPPANADSQYKKARVIMVAVKNTGRVFMHKARENPDNTFQIGKSWPLEELGQIESFSPDVERAQEDVLRANLAGPAGFVISMSKPYYWKAMTPKEKDFFIASLCKIYRKYTSGQLPQLKGFNPREEAEIMGASQATPRPPGPPGPSGPPGSLPPSAIPGGLPPPIRPDDGRASPQMHGERPGFRGNRPSDISVDSSKRSVSNDSSSQRPPSPLRHRNVTPGAYDRGQTPPQGPPAGVTPRLRPQPSQDSGHLRMAQSRENMNGGRLQTPGFPPPRLSPQPSQSSFPRNSPHPPNDAPLRSPRFPPGPSSGSPEPLRQYQKGMPPDALNGARAATDRLRSPSQPAHPSPASSYFPTESNASNGSLESSAARQVLPERRRPPLEESGLAQPSPLEESAAVPKPLNSRTVPLRPGHEPAPSPQLDPPRMPGAFVTPSSTPPPVEPSARDSPRQVPGAVQPLQAPPPFTSNSRPSTPLTSTTNAARVSPSSPPQLKPVTTSSSPLKRTEERPSVVPPTTDKEPSQNDVTSPDSVVSPGSVSSPGGARSRNWNKAFNAANTAAKLTAFKPRAGGAAGRLFAEKKDTGEPDGITGVVPAPQTPMPRPDGNMATQIEKTPTHSATNSLVKNNTSANEVGLPRLSTGDRAREPVPEEDVLRPALPSKFEESVTTLGVDRNLLSGRGQEYESTLANFGWIDNVLQTRTIEGLETSLRKEVGKLEAGSWLGYSDGKDIRIEDFEKMLDRAIAECDEMEGLLTLYGVELSTLTEDISYIESQSGGIQVQTANQKLLQTELQKLVKGQGQGYGA